MLGEYTFLVVNGFNLIASGLNIEHLIILSWNQILLKSLRWSLILYEKNSPGLCCSCWDILLYSYGYSCLAAGFQKPITFWHMHIHTIKAGLYHWQVMHL